MQRSSARIRNSTRQEEEKTMNITEIKTIAKEQGIKTTKMTKGELIKAIQTVEGNRDCFGEAMHVHCEQTECLWYGDCQPR
jgi:Rho termination factor-like protein